MVESQIVVFALNGEVCGVDASQVYKIVRCKDLVKIPQMPKFVDGMINHMGKAIPVINLNRRFGFGEIEITKKTKIIITQTGKNYLGFMVNDVSEIITISDNDMEDAPGIIAQAGNTYLKKVAKKGSSIISILDFNYILSDKELNKITNKKAV